VILCIGTFLKVILAFKILNLFLAMSHQSIP